MPKENQPERLPNEVLIARENLKISLRNSPNYPSQNDWKAALGNEFWGQEALAYKLFPLISESISFSDINTIAFILEINSNSMPSNGCVPNEYLAQMIFFKGPRAVLNAILTSNMGEPLQKRMDDEEIEIDNL